MVPRDSPMGSGVDTVRRDLIFDCSGSAEMQIFLRGSADDGIFRKDHDAGMVGTYAELVLRADHAE